MPKFKVIFEFGQAESESYQTIEIDAMTAIEAEEKALDMLDDRVRPYLLTYWSTKTDNLEDYNG